MTNAAMTVEELAEAVGVDPKSVQRWIAGEVTPHARHRGAAAAALLADPEWLWPPKEAVAAVEQATPTSVIAEVADAFAHRAEVPKEAWWALLSGAAHRIDLLAYAMQFLPEDHIDLCDLLSRKVRGGCAIRICLADPDSAVVAERDAEEGLGGTMAARIRTTLGHLEPLVGTHGVEFRMHATPMYNSVFRGDDELFYTQHLYGLRGYRAPLFHLRRARDRGLFDNILAHIDRVWASARSYP